VYTAVYSKDEESLPRTNPYVVREGATRLTGSSVQYAD
jgi:hypothetical protein